MFGVALLIACAGALAGEDPSPAAPARQGGVVAIDGAAPPAERAAGHGGVLPIDGAEVPPDAFLSDDPGGLEPVRLGARGVLVKRGGQVLLGKVIRMERGAVTVRQDGDDTVVTVPASTLRGMVPRTVPEGTLAGRPRARVVLRDGSVLVADTVTREAGRTVLLAGQTRREVADPDVALVVRIVEERAAIALHEQHLEAPSAFLLPAGGITLSSRDLVHLELNAGVLPWLSLSAGTALPALQAESYARNFQLSARGGLPVTPWLHVAAGVHGDFADGGTIVTASATVSLGSASSHLTLHAGPTFPGSEAFAAGMGVSGLAVAGTLRLAPWADGIAECWSSSSDGERSTIALLATRLRLGRFGLDFGFGRSFPDAELFPWFGLHVDAGRTR